MCDVELTPVPGKVPRVSSSGSAVKPTPARSVRRRTAKAATTVPQGMQRLKRHPAHENAQPHRAARARPLSGPGRMGEETVMVEQAAEVSWDNPMPTRA